MASDTITSLKALEVLDSRGNPTVEVEIRLEGGASRPAHRVKLSAELHVRDSSQRLATESTPMPEEATV